MWVVTWLQKLVEKWTDYVQANRLVFIWNQTDFSLACYDTFEYSCLGIRLITPRPLACLLVRLTPAFNFATTGLH
jgi:hypothetical protein